MSTTGQQLAATDRDSARTDDGFGSLAAQEWRTLRRRRCTRVIVPLAFVLFVALSAAISLAGSRGGGPGGTTDPSMLAGSWQVGLVLGRVLFPVLGVLAVAPAGGARRIAARLAVLAVTAFVVAMVSSLVAFTVQDLVFAANGVDVGFGTYDSGRILFGAGLYMTLLALFGGAVRLLVGRTWVAMVVALALLLVPLLGSGAGSPALVRNWFLANPASQVLNVNVVPGGIAPWAGLAVFAVECLVLLVLGVVVAGRRPAHLRTA